MSEGLTLQRVMAGAIRSYTREHGHEPAALVIGRRDVKWLRQELWLTEPTDKLPAEFEGVPVSTLEDGSGCMAMGGAQWLRLVATGSIKPL